MKPHERILHELARAHLSPAGFVQKGRSRLWYEDRGWWLLVVELKPSGFSRGTALNLAAHWLWWGQDHVSFDFSCAPMHGFVEFTDEVAFRARVDDMLRMAVVDAAELRDACTPITAAAKRLRGVPHRVTWQRANTGIASALAGDASAAHQELRAVSAEHASADWHRDLCRRAAELDALVDDDAAFRSVIADRIGVSRAALKLPPWSGPIT